MIEYRKMTSILRDKTYQTVGLDEASTAHGMQSSVVKTQLINNTNDISTVINIDNKKLETVHIALNIWEL